MPDKINLDEGVTIRFKPDGSRVHMYKSRPGEFLDVHGVQVDEEQAAAAGFDVKALGAEKRRKARYEDARKRIDEEAAEELRKLEEKDAEDDKDGDFRIEHAGGGRYHVVGPDGKLTDKPMAKKEAQQRAKELNDGTQTPARLKPLDDGNGAS